VLEFPRVRKEQQINETSRELPRESSASASFPTASSTSINWLVYKPAKRTRKLSSSLHTEGSRQAFPQKNASTDPISKITLNPYLFSGSLDSTRSPPDESWSRGSSPRLEQAHPHIYPDERRSSVVSFDSTVAPSSPQPASPKSKKRERRPQATQADTVLLKFLAPDQPLVAIRAGESPLSWSTGSEGNNEIDMEGGAQDGDGGGGSSKENNQNESREQSADQPNGGTGEASGEGSTNNGESGPCGNGGGDERKGNSGGGMGGKGGRDNDKGDDEDSKDLGKGKGTEEKNRDEDKDEDKEKAQSTGNDNMDIDTVTTDALKAHDIPKPKKGAPPPGYEGGPGEVEPSSSETAVSLMALAAGDDRPFTSATSLPGIPSGAGGTAWAPNARAKSPNPSQSRGLPPSPGPSTQLYQNNKLPLLNSPTQLPSMVSSMNSQPTSSPNSLPPGNDGRHTTLPPVSSIQVLAELAEKALPTQSSTFRTNNRLPPNPRTVYPTVSSHVSVAPSNRTAQAPRSPGFPAPPGQSPRGGFGPDSNSRPPVHHMSVQQRAQLMNNQDPQSPYYGNPHQHYQSQYPPMKEGASSNTNGSTVPFQSSTTHPRELPGIMQNHSPSSSGFFSPPALSGRRDSANIEYYPTSNTPPSGPSTGDTMPSSGTEDTITSPRSRSTVVPGAQGPLASGGFKCDFPGCKAAPFQTQYLLK